MDPQTLRGATFGALDGLVTCLAIVLGVHVGGLEPREVTITALAAAFAGACSMASGEIVSMTAHNNHDGADSNTSPYKVGAVSFVAFLFGSALVIVPMFFLNIQSLAYISMFSMFMLGWFTSHSNPVAGGLRSVFFGSLACTATLVLGYLIGGSL